MKKPGKTNNKKMNINPVAVGVAGAAVGAGVAVAASAAMNNKKTRAQVEKVVKTVQKQAAEYVDNIKADNIQKGKKALGKAAATVKKQIQSSASTKNGSRQARGGSKKISARPSSHA